MTDLAKCTPFRLSRPQRLFRRSSRGFWRKAAFRGIKLSTECGIVAACRCTLVAISLALSSLALAAAEDSATSAAIPLGRWEASAPLRDFALPQFAPEGHREWLLRGREAVFEAESQQVRVVGLFLDIFRADQPALPIFQVASTLAVIDPIRRQAQSDAFLQVLASDGSFRLAGRGWQWEAPAARLTVKSEVRVVFALDLAAVLTLDP